MTRGGNAHCSFWTCRYCQERIIEDSRKENRTKYYEVLPCQAALEATSEILGAVTEKRSGTPKDQIPTPPYPWPDRATWVTMKGKAKPVYTGGIAPAIPPEAPEAKTTNTGASAAKGGPGPSQGKPPAAPPQWRQASSGSQGSTLTTPATLVSTTATAETARVRSASAKRVAIAPLPHGETAMEDNSEAYRVPVPPDSLQAENARLQAEVQELKTAITQMMASK